MLFAQYEINIEAFVFNKENAQHIPYVNIGVKGKTIKTITNKNGKFTLQFDEDVIAKTDIIQFYILGYKSQEVEASQFYRFLKNTNKIYLIPEDFIKQITADKTVISQGNIYGKITSDNLPIQGATVRVKNSFIEVQTDVDGNYRINANKEDILVIDFLGTKPKEIHVSGNNKIDIQMESDGELLDEVILTGDARKEETIDLGLNGEKNFDAIGYSVNTVTSKDIKPHYTSLMEVLGGKFAGIPWSVPSPGRAPILKLRNQNSLSIEVAAIYDVDGQIFNTNQGQVPIIDVQNISSATVLKSLASTNKYGTIGRGGVIVIKTKTAGFDLSKPETDTALVKGNDYLENLPLINATQQLPMYIKELQKASSFKEAKQIYKTQKNELGLTIPYLLDVTDYFRKWDKDFAHDILMSISRFAYNNAKALKTLAFKLEELNQLDDAKLIYQRIAVLRPKDAQSYRDLALIYQQTGNFTEAMELYGQMLNNEIEDVDFLGLENTIKSELQHLLKRHRSKVDYSNIHADYLQADFKYDLRIVFEWNDPYAEFEVQFVNPQKKFFTWNHTKLDNRKRMLEGITKGYFTEEFIIDDDELGEWIINIEVLNDEPQLNPTYLKYTVYRDYGLVNETKDVKVINLKTCKPKVTIYKLLYQ